MSDFFKRAVTALKMPKTLMLLGLFGIVLIFVSSLIPEKSAENTASVGNTDTEVYRAELQNEVLRIVKGITGDKNCTVVITLESGVRYTYADTNEEDNSTSSGQNLEESSSSSAKSYITVKTADGGERPLVIAEIMPQVRGVAIVCNGGDDKNIKEKITGAVTAALDITSKRVYVAGGNTYEKG